MILFNFYPAIDPAGRVSGRRNFAVAVYPGHLSLADNSFGLHLDLDRNITRQTSPTFLLQNEGGRVDSAVSVQALFTFQAASNCSAVKSSGTTPSEA
jgi:hypothetical protein